MDRSCNCPQCGSPDVFVVRWPDIVECLVCGSTYQFDELAGTPAPDHGDGAASTASRTRPCDNSPRSPLHCCYEADTLLLRSRRRSCPRISACDPGYPSLVEHALPRVLPRGAGLFFGAVLAMLASAPFMTFTLPRPHRRGFSFQ